MGIETVVLGVERVYGLRASGALLRFVRLLRRRRPHVLHTYLSSANVFGALAAELAGVGCLITTRRDTGFGDGRLMRLALRITSRWAHRVVAVSHEVGELARRRDSLSPSRLEVIPNGIDLERFSPAGRRAETRKELQIPAGARVALTVGHLTHIKGVDVLIEAAARLGTDLPQTIFLVVGSGNRLGDLQRSIELHQLGSRFRLLGERSDVPELLEAADLFVLPSRSEGQPNSLLEAMATGLPVVATRVGGVPELCADGREGLLVPPDDAAALGGALGAILTSPDLARRLGRAARERAERDFSVTTMVRRYEQLYETVVTGARS
jgi:glycosyltransferase involved in cell wall biosynthesis